MTNFIVFVVVSALSIVSWWRVFKRVGWPTWLALLTFLPPVSLGVLVALAFMAWPVDRNSAGIRQAEPLASPVQMFCPHCGKGGDTLDRFCRECGKAVG